MVELESLEIVVKELHKLEEENKKLKEEVEVWKNANKKLRMHDARMEYENKKLKEKNEKLKSDLSECECSMHFENDEV
jgi:predicted nuclease with TOPRIM domain